MICIYCKRPPPLGVTQCLFAPKGFWGGAQGAALRFSSSSPWVRCSYHTRQRHRAASGPSSHRLLVGAGKCHQKFSYCGIPVTGFGTPCQSSPTPLLLLLPALFAHLLLAERRFSILQLPEQPMERINITLQFGWTKTGMAVVVMPKIS